MGESEHHSYVAARSVHLWWQPPVGNVTAFYTEACVLKTTMGSYFMACGFGGGYFGIQDGPDGLTGIRRVLFSVWDAGSEMCQGRDNPSETVEPERVGILHSGAHLQVKRFGGEGTGAQCLDDSTGWEVGQRVRFLVIHAGVLGEETCYAAFVDSGKGWCQQASLRVSCGKAFQGFYSFIEDFRRDIASVDEQRHADFGPAWFRLDDGTWSAASAVTFSGSNADWERPDNIDTLQTSAPGVQALATGGQICGMRKLGTKFELDPGASGPPSDLPEFPPWFAEMSHVAISAIVQAGCPICGCSVSEAEGENNIFCGSGACRTAQCTATDSPLDCGGIQSGACIWPCAKGSSVCSYHASKGGKCALCHGTVSNNGPYCAGTCCGSRQCQAKSIVIGHSRCNWACAPGHLTCYYHLRN